MVTPNVGRGLFEPGRAGGRVEFAEDCLVRLVHIFLPLNIYDVHERNHGSGYHLDIADACGVLCNTIEYDQTATNGTSTRHKVDRSEPGRVKAWREAGGEWIRELRPETRERSRRRRCLHRYLEPRIDCGDAVRTTEWAAHRRCQRGWHRGRLQASVPFLGWGFFCCPGADTRERREHGRGSGDDDAEYGGRHHTDDG